MARFLPGQSGNLQGKPKGCRDKRQFSLTYWFNLIQDQWSELSPNQRANIALDCWKVLVNKAKTLPTDPTDSVMNVEAVTKLLEDIEKPHKESNIKQPSQTASDVNIVTKPS